MKKIISCVIATFASVLLFASSYKVSSIDFSINGCKGINFGKTNEKSLLLKYPIDTKTVFESVEKFNIYVLNYKEQLESSRLFEAVEMKYETTYTEENDIYNVALHFDLVDSNHLLALPYPKYTSNDGFTLKLKVKDTNFLGSLNPLSSDISFKWTESNEFNFGINFNYDYPFKLGIFNATWANDFSIDYTVGDKRPDFSTTTGLGLSLPLDYFTINFGGYQTIGYNTDGHTIFKEELEFSTPLTLYKLSNFTNVAYSPYLKFGFDWYLKNSKINNPVNDNLYLKFGHSLSNSKINFSDFYRDGYSVVLSNDFIYDIEDCTINPSFTMEISYYNNFKLFNGNFLNRFGIATRLFAYTAIDIPFRPSPIDNPNASNIKIGSRIRGILDDEISTPCAIVLNFDMPFNLFTTNFPLEIINFNMQFSPFIDIALMYNEEEGSVFSVKKGAYCAGLEILVNPVKFSSYTIRGSIGFDLKSALKYDGNKIKGLWKNKEIYIGLDYHF